MTITDTPPGGDTVVKPDRVHEQTRRPRLRRDLARRRHPHPGHPRCGGAVPLRRGLAHLRRRSSEFDESFVSYVAPLLFGTIWAASLALLMALPLAVGVALFVSHYAPKRLAVSLGYFIDLLAAIPSVVFGLWGIAVLAPILAAQRVPVARGQPRVPPVLRRPGLHERTHDDDRRPRARRDDPADHHGDLA